MQHFDTVAIGGHRLAVRRIAGERPDAPAIVFLHEALGSIGQWKNFPAELCAATGCAGLVYDRAGHGHSSPVTDARTMRFYDDEADTLLALLEREQIARPVLFGHSDGATIALAFAGRYPDAPRAVISEAAHVIIEQITIDGIRAAAEAYERTDLPQKLARYHGDKTDAVFFAWADTWRAEEAIHWEMRETLRAVRCPVLAVQGEDDDYGSPAQLDAIALECAGPTEILLIPRCGHVPHLQMRAMLVERSAAFIRSVG